ncbi:GRAM domain-containing protein 4-like isoform X1 [Ptychodera flava]|uniref:GRAM domain-containing protein 4-like isoform X1 n=1 Tax=Ptychodera flava TaxID=63121 RepID=UPI003969EA3C
MYSVWHGWLATVLLGTLLYWLSKNYVMSKLQTLGWFKGWHVDICILPYDFIDEDNDSDKALGMSDKFQLVLQVARKVQNLMGKAADSLEKLKNLVMWEHPESTRKLYFFCSVAFVASIFLPGKLLFKITGLFLGVKLFVINSVYRKFPRVKRRYDSMVKIWKELPTDAELKTRMQMAEREQYMLPTSSSNTSLTSGSQMNRSQTAQAVLSGENQAFCRLFSLPPAEAPLPDWHGGKRCTLISKEKTLTGAFKNGKLYLTRSFLCFERSKYPTPKNLVIPLADITSLEKAKPYGFLPGGGMAIEIGVSGCDKPYLFGAMINRDEAYESIIRAAQQACLAWAIEDDEVTPSETSTFDS